MYSLILLALLLGCVQCGPFTATVTTSASNFKIGQDVRCEVTITNQDNHDRFLYTRGTPFEGFKSDIFLVTCNKKPVRYNALHFKSGPISENSNGINIPSKGSVAVMVDLSSAYSFKYSASYSVSLNTKVHYLDDEGEVDECHLYSMPIKFAVSGGPGGTPKLTIAEKHLNQAKFNILPAVGMKAGTPKNLAFDGKYDTYDQSNATNAWSDAYRSIVASPADMDNNTDHYNLWFGSATHKDTAKGTVQDIQRAMEVFNYTLYFRGPECTPGDDYAYTFFRSGIIYLCDLFFDAKEHSGFNSKYGILVNQLSQIVADIDHDPHDAERCKHLAKYNPQLAVRNSYNYEYFVETLKFGKTWSIMW